jgi:hypothetical protein
MSDVTNQYPELDLNLSLTIFCSVSEVLGLQQTCLQFAFPFTASVWQRPYKSFAPGFQFAIGTVVTEKSISEISMNLGSKN